LTQELTEEVVISLDLEFRSLKSEGKGKYKINPVVLALETPDSILCDKAKIKLIPDDNLVNIEFIAAKAQLGTIGITMDIETLSRIIAALDKEKAKKCQNEETLKP